MVRSLFAVVGLVAMWSGQCAAAPSESAYRLNPGDVVMVSVWQEDMMLLTEKKLQKKSWPKSCSNKTSPYFCTPKRNGLVVKLVNELGIKFLECEK